MSEQHVRELLQKHGLERLADQVVSSMRPSIRLLLAGTNGIPLDPLPDIRPVGVSKVGGDPDLPPGMDWPYWEDIALSFVTQINLPEVADLDLEQALPPKGMLYLFYEASLTALISDSQESSCRIMYYDGDLSALQRTAAPADQTQSECERLTPCQITFRQEMTIPMMDSIEFNQFGLEHLGDEWEQYRLFYCDWTDERDADGSLSGGTVPQHRLLGCPDTMYNDGRWGCSGTTEQAGGSGDAEGERQEELQQALQWRLLFQIDSDYNNDINWGDAGFIYFFIHKDDLVARRFDRVCAVYEGH